MTDAVAEQTDVVRAFCNQLRGLEGAQLEQLSDDAKKLRLALIATGGELSSELRQHITSVLSQISGPLPQEKLAFADLAHKVAQGARLPAQGTGFSYYIAMARVAQRMPGIGAVITPLLMIYESANGIYKSRPENRDKELADDPKLRSITLPSNFDHGQIRGLVSQLSERSRDIPYVGEKLAAYFTQALESLGKVGQNVDKASSPTLAFGATSPTPSLPGRS
jgi:hypothetical protein